MERMDAGMPFLLKYENVAWYENGKVRILDRRIFPEVRFVECSNYQEVVKAIADMVTQRVSRNIAREAKNRRFAPVV